MNTDPRAASPEHAPTPHLQRVLVVCAANVCRSPAAALSLRVALEASASHHGRWVVDSAGTDAQPGQTMCRRSASYASRIPGGPELATTHRSQLLNQQLVEESGLVLVASQSERAAVAALSPAARRRTFTLREAAMMMSRALDVRGRGVLLTTSPEELLTTVVDLLHEQRGTLAISAGPAHFSARRRRGDSGGRIDIGDVHQGQERRHKPVLEACFSASRELAAGIGRIDVSPTSPAPGQAATRHPGTADDAHPR